MPIRRSPNGAHHPHPQAGRDRPEWVVAINRNAWSQSIGIAGRDHPVCASCAWALAKYDGHDGIPDVAPVARYAVIAEVSISTAFAAFPVRADAEPWISIP